MTVSELIEKLKHLPAGLSVVAYDHMQETDMVVRDARIKTIEVGAYGFGIEGVIYNGGSVTEYDSNFKEGDSVVVLFDYC